jgi:hypothetical protein
MSNNSGAQEIQGPTPVPPSEDCLQHNAGSPVHVDVPLFPPLEQVLPPSYPENYPPSQGYGDEYEPQGNSGALDFVEFIHPDLFVHVEGPLIMPDNTSNVDELPAHPHSIPPVAASHDLGPDTFATGNAPSAPEPADYVNSTLYSLFLLPIVYALTISLRQTRPVENHKGAANYVYSK